MNCVIEHHLDVVANVLANKKFGEYMGGSDYYPWLDYTIHYDIFTNLYGNTFNYTIDEYANVLRSKIKVIMNDKT